jgi:CRP-like cAMP-binding protein
MSVRAAGPGTLLVLSRPDFAALLARRHPASFSLKRRLAALLTARLRNQLAQLAASLGDVPPDGEPGAPAQLEPCSPPDSKYIRRMTTFHDFDPVALWGFLTSGSYAECARGTTLVAEGAPPTAYYLTMGGAVETVLIRGGRRIRVGLAGPGKAFGYESLIDGQPSPVTAVARERALLLVIPERPFGELFGGENAVSHVFLDVIQRDLTAAVRQTLRPHARFAASL